MSLQSVTNQSGSEHGAVMHCDSAKRDEHEKMGFFDSWGTTLEQMVALVERL